MYEGADIIENISIFFQTLQDQVHQLQMTYRVALIGNLNFLFAVLGLQGATATDRIPWSEINKDHLINAHKDGSPHHLGIASCQFPIRKTERQDAYWAQVSQQGEEEPRDIAKDFGSGKRN